MKKTDENIRYHELVVETYKSKPHLDAYERRQFIYSQLILAKLLGQKKEGKTH